MPIDAGKDSPDNLRHDAHPRNPPGRQFTRFSRLQPRARHPPQSLADASESPDAKARPATLAETRAGRYLGSQPKPPPNPNRNGGPQKKPAKRVARGRRTRKSWAGDVVLERGFSSGLRWSSSTNRARMSQETPLSRGRNPVKVGRRAPNAPGLGIPNGLEAARIPCLGSKSGPEAGWNPQVRLTRRPKRQDDGEGGSDLRAPGEITHSKPRAAL